MTFSCTNKVFNQLKKYKTFETEKEDIGLYNWYVDLINLDRKNYFLFTNSKTLFSFFVYAGTKKEKVGIERIFEDMLQEQIIRQIGTAPKYLSNCLRSNEKYKFTKTNSRSVLGSMNDYKDQIKVQLQHRGNLEKNFKLINYLLTEVPMGGIKYKIPRDTMKEELEKGSEV